MSIFLSSLVLIHYLQVPLRHRKEDHEVIPKLRSLLTDNRPPRQGKVGHTTGVGSFTSHKRTRYEIAVRQDLQISSLSEKTRKSNRLQPAFGIYAKNAQKMNHKEPWHNSMFIKILKRKTGKVTVELNSRKMQRTIPVVSL